MNMQERFKLHFDGAVCLLQLYLCRDLRMVHWALAEGFLLRGEEEEAGLSLGQTC